MRIVIVYIFVFLSTLPILLVCFGPRALGVEEPKKPLIEPQRVSPKRGVDASQPDFVRVRGNSYLVWKELTDGATDLSIATVDPETKQLGPTERALAPEMPGVVSILSVYAVIGADAAPPMDSSPSAFLVAYSDTPWKPYAGNHRYYRFARLLPNRKEAGYRTESLGRFLPDNTDQNPRGGFFAPERISLLRRAGAKASLFLVGSNYTRMWSISSEDGGKTWSTPSIIAEDGCGLASVVESSDGQLLLFSNATTRAGAGRYTEVHLRRSKDGRSWSDPKEIIDGHQLLQTCPFVDGKLLWLAYADKNPKGGGSTLFLTRSADEGKTWEVALPLTDGSHDDAEPVIAIQGGTLNLAFVRTVPRRPGAREGDVKHQIWFGQVAVKDVQFPKPK